jgi:hypothetical protein
MSIYQNMAATAKKLLTKFGQPVTITSYAAASYNPATGASSLTGTDTVTVGAIFSYKDTMVDGTMVKRGDKYLLCPIAADVGDKVSLVIGTYSVIDVKPINPAGTPVMYKFNLRGVA